MVSLVDVCSVGYVLYMYLLSRALAFSKSHLLHVWWEEKWDKWEGGQEWLRAMICDCMCGDDTSLNEYSSNNINTEDSK